MTNLDHLERIARAATKWPWIGTDGCAVFADGAGQPEMAVFGVGGANGAAPEVQATLRALLAKEEA